MMELTDTLLERNQRFAADRFTPGLELRPSLQTMVISCVDPRVDPAHILGLEDGEAIVIRNIGGRFVPSTFQTMAMLRALAMSEGMTPGPGWNLVFLQHTDCGITRLAGLRDVLAAYFGVGADAVDGLAIGDPAAALHLDLAAVRANPMLPAEFTVSGLLYDMGTGLVEVVVPPAPLRLQASAA